ncbi:putative porin [Acinetobacter sp. ANC 4648]|uniref:putative porin n=1 Tax=Acinetobacter sp. ANC 4648 TaxID=1977875 RepID=UPI000A331024|nr:putative porin [Acinetobacter sp. ANC 4648]OTG85010.1 putative porin [Acinetobacter sp. ANC 4648]
MKKLAIASALLSALAMSGTANAYQAEVGGSYTYTDWDDFDGTHNFGVDGTYYFNPVQTRNVPLNEAAFLDRASNVKAQVNYGNNNDVKNTEYAVGAEYFVPNSDFYLSGDVGRNERKVDNTNIDLKVTTYAAEVGYLPAPGLLIAAGVKGYDAKHGDDGADPTIRAKYVTTLGNGKDINLEAGAAFGDLDEYRVRGDYYLDKTLSVGADYYNNGLTDHDEFGLSAKKFLNQQVSLEGRVGFGNDDNTYGVRAAYRF